MLTKVEDLLAGLHSLTPQAHPWPSPTQSAIISPTPDLETSECPKNSATVSPSPTFETHEDPRASSRGVEVSHLGFVMVGTWPDPALFASPNFAATVFPPIEVRAYFKFIPFGSQACQSH